MALTRDQVAEKVIARLIEKGEKEDGILKPDVLSWIDEGLKRLARRVLDGPEYRELQKEISLSITAGKATISDSTVIVDSIPETGLVMVGSTIAKWKPRYQSLLQSSLQTDVYHYALRGNVLHFKDTSGSLSFIGTATVLANFVPTTLNVSSTTDLPVRFENQLIDTLIEMSAEKKFRKPQPLIQAGDNE